MLDEQCVYELIEDFYTYDYDGNDNFGILYKKGEYVFICDAGRGEGGYYALIASKDVTISWGPAGMRDLLPLLKKVDLDILKDESAAKLLLTLNGNMSIYDNKIRWNR